MINPDKDLIERAEKILPWSYTPFRSKENWPSTRKGLVEIIARSLQVIRDERLSPGLAHILKQEIKAERKRGGGLKEGLKLIEESNCGCPDDSGTWKITEHRRGCSRRIACETLAKYKEEK